ncbi:MAG: hypothetical protein WCO61_09835 [Alphaproteobacteria bacterium]
MNTPNKKDIIGATKSLLRVDVFPKPDNDPVRLSLSDLPRIYALVGIYRLNRCP